MENSHWFFSAFAARHYILIFYQIKHLLLNYCSYHNLVAEVIFGKWGGCIYFLGASVFG